MGDESVRLLVEIDSTATISGASQIDAAFKKTEASVDEAAKRATSSLERVGTAARDVGAQSAAAADKTAASVERVGSAHLSLANASAKAFKGMLTGMMAVEAFSDHSEKTILKVGVHLATAFAVAGPLGAAITGAAMALGALTAADAEAERAAQAAAEAHRKWFEDVKQGAKEAADEVDRLRRSTLAGQMYGGNSAVGDEHRLELMQRWLKTQDEIHAKQTGIDTLFSIPNRSVDQSVRLTEMERDLAALLEKAAAERAAIDADAAARNAKLQLELHQKLEQNKTESTKAAADERAKLDAEARARAASEADAIHQAQLDAVRIDNTREGGHLETVAEATARERREKEAAEERKRAQREAMEAFLKEEEVEKRRLDLIDDGNEALAHEIDLLKAGTDEERRRLDIEWKIKQMKEKNLDPALIAQYEAIEIQKISMKSNAVFEFVHSLEPTLAGGLTDLIMDGITNGFRNGEQIAKSLVDTMLRQVLNSIIQSGIQAAFSGLFSGGGGGGGGGGGFGGILGGLVGAFAGGGGGGSPGAEAFGGLTPTETFDAAGGICEGGG